MKANIKIISFKSQDETHQDLYTSIISADQLYITGVGKKQQLKHFDFNEEFTSVSLDEKMIIEVQIWDYFRKTDSLICKKTIDLKKIPTKYIIEPLLTPKGFYAGDIVMSITDLRRQAIFKKSPSIQEFQEKPEKNLMTQSQHDKIQPSPFQLNNYYYHKRSSQRLVQINEKFLQNFNLETPFLKYK